MPALVETTILVTGVTLLWNKTHYLNVWSISAVFLSPPEDSGEEINLSRKENKIYFRIEEWWNGMSGS